MTDNDKILLDLFKLLQERLEIKLVNNIPCLCVDDESVLMLTETQRKVLENFRNIPYSKWFKI